MSHSTHQDFHNAYFSHFPTSVTVRAFSSTEFLSHIQPPTFQEKGTFQAPHYSTLFSITIFQPGKPNNYNIYNNLCLFLDGSASKINILSKYNISINTVHVYISVWHPKPSRHWSLPLPYLMKGT